MNRHLVEKQQVQPSDTQLQTGNGANSLVSLSSPSAGQPVVGHTLENHYKGVDRLSLKNCMRLHLGRRRERRGTGSDDRPDVLNAVTSVGSILSPHHLTQQSTL